MLKKTIVVFNSFFLPLLLLVIPVTHADVVVKINKESGLLSWANNQDGFSIELIQLTPDFVRAIYESHNLPAVEIERIANYCVFGTIIKNTSNQLLTYSVSDWSYRYKNKKFNVKTKTQWIEEWKKAGITFSWTLLPDAGQFNVGDWQQGFTTIELPRKSRFDMDIRWSINEKEYNLNLKDVRCAPATLAK